MMLAGAAVSQTSLLPNDWFVQNIFFPDDIRPKIPETLGGFAFVLYWFLEGVKVDVGMIKKTGLVSIVTGIVTVLFPIFTANFVFGSLRYTGSKNLTGVEYRTMIFMQSISTFTGISRLIRDLEINHSEFGRIVLSTSMVSDATGDLEGQLYETLHIIFVVSGAKILFSIIPPLVAKMPITDSIVMAFILSNKGIVELCYFMYAVERKALNPKNFTTMAMMILISSTVLPVVIHYLYDASQRLICFQKRNLVILKLGSELKFLVCIHRSDHITGMINLLETYFPLEDSSLTCYVLNLVELAGSDNPLFISHQMQKTEPGSRSYSSNVLIAFNTFKQYWISITLELFTSISNPKYMHQEIYTLALDKQASLIILPFHRVWSLDQTTVVSDDITRRNVNINVLRQAPCSVGIFVHRQNMFSTQNSSPDLKVCTIFVGGKDDREALAMVQQMMRNQKVNLTVLKIVPRSLVGMTTGWDQMLDTAQLKETLRNNNTNLGGEHSFVEFLEEEINDGSDTARILLSIANSFDLFVVGRSTGSGTDVTRALSDWVEFDELGVIGDLLVSSDFPHRASVLVVQQQQNVACR
ncbi:hypothetical protein AALP_AA1G082100 [Arabis alpina]|uniref:Cation/H+ exchanger domain-containing protein n=1 Tax=Arabis alpina TaxID=50452 RepID=A0A087HLW4_ARAAL|nr:hypothetical protein AALP_AA1G082100 [Arabis alpina]